MAGVVCVTREGHGDFWMLPSRSEALIHPLVQYGDPIVPDANFMAMHIPPRMVAVWLRRAKDPRLAEMYLSVDPRMELQPWQRRDRLKGVLPDAWRLLVSVCRPAPSDPDEIVRLVRQDRRILMAKDDKTRTNESASTAPGGHKRTGEATVPGAMTESAQEQLDKTSTVDPGEVETIPEAADAMNIEAAAAEAGDKPGEKKGGAIRQSKFKDDMIITMGSDKDGKAYSAEHNPKRAGSASADRFSKYKDGMTVKQYVDAVGDRAKAMADLNHDTTHNFVSVAGSADETEGEKTA